MVVKKVLKASLCIAFVGFQIFLIQGCKSTSSAATKSTESSTAHKSAERITAVGSLLPQGTTSYQYGTFILVDQSGKTLYALKSDAVQLLNYKGKKVSLTGMLIEGYPIEGGPPYLDVLTVEELATH